MRPLNYVCDKNLNTLVHILNSKEKKNSYDTRNFIMIYVEAAINFQFFELCRKMQFTSKKEVQPRKLLATRWD